MQTFPQSWNALRSFLAIAVLLACSRFAAGQLSLTPTKLTYADIALGGGKTLAASITNDGTTDVTISTVATSASWVVFKGWTTARILKAGATAKFSVSVFPPARGTWTGKVLFYTGSSTVPRTYVLTGVCRASFLKATPASSVFGKIKVKSSLTKTQTLKNTGNAPLSINSVAATTGSGFSYSGLTFPTELAAGESVTFSVQFSPRTEAAIVANLNIISNAYNGKVQVPLKGTGVPAGTLAASPASASFGSVIVGTSKTMNATLTATGAPITVASASTTDPEFTLTGLTLPLTIPMGKSASFSLAFTPKATGAVSGKLSFVSDASVSSIAESVTGAGAPAPQHEVSLAWAASPSAVVGYNVYRGSTSAGPYAKLNTALSATNTYTDKSVVAGQTYFYAATSVDALGKESSYSNKVQAIIPTP
jgi:hypothetical protein